MPFTHDIIRSASVSVVGLAKNAGKTVCLNYIIDRTHALTRLAVTSIGLDGETTDQVTLTGKPDITLRRGMLFVTTERFFRDKNFPAEIHDVGSAMTPTGRLVTATALDDGKIILAGPSDTETLRRTIAGLKELGAGTVLVDGALSRLSSASPAVSESMVLATGASVAGTIAEVVRKTKYVHDLIQLPKTGKNGHAKLQDYPAGLWRIEENGPVPINEAGTCRSADGPNEPKNCDEKSIFIGGALTDRLLTSLSAEGNVDALTLIVKDFTRIFANSAAYYSFRKQGGRIKVLRRPRLLAICVNPFSPTGRHLNARELAAAVREATGAAVYDVRDMEN